MLVVLNPGGCICIFAFWLLAAIQYLCLEGRRANIGRQTHRAAHAPLCKGHGNFVCSLLAVGAEERWIAAIKFIFAAGDRRAAAEGVLLVVIIAGLSLGHLGAPFLVVHMWYY